MHCGRNDVVRGFVAQLHDELAQIRLPDGDANFLERRGQVNFFRHHRLGLNDGFHVASAGQFNDVVVGLLGIFRPVNMAAALDDMVFELGEMLREIGDAFGLHCGTAATRSFPVGEAQLALGVRGVVAQHAFLDEGAMFQVGRLDDGLAKKFLGGSAHRDSFALAGRVAELARMPAR